MLTFIGGSQSLQGKILIVCGLSAGYVPIYALDNLIQTNGFKRIAFFQSDHLEPSVGYLPIGIQNGALGLPGQLYLNGNIVLLQFRSFVRFGRKKDLVSEIGKIVKTQKLKDVIVLGSLPYSIKPDRQINSLQKTIYFYKKGILGEQIKVSKCSQLKIIYPLQLLKDEDEKQEIILSNAGLSNNLLKQLENVLILLIFCQQVQDKATGIYLSKELHKIIDAKQISKIN